MPQYYNSNPPSKYPNSYDSFITKVDAQVIPEGTVDSGEWVMAGHLNHMQNAIGNIEKTLGVLPNGTYPTLAQRLGALTNSTDQRTRLGYFGGDPFFANRTDRATGLDQVAPTFRAFDFVIYSGDELEAMTELSRLSAFQIIPKLERDTYTNQVNTARLVDWRSLGFTTIYVEYTQSQADVTQIDSIKTFVDWIHGLGNRVILGFPEDIQAAFSAKLNRLGLVSGDGIIIYNYAGAAAYTKDISDSIIAVRLSVPGIKIGGLSYVTGTSVMDAYLFGLGLSVVYGFDYYGLAEIDNGILKAHAALAYPRLAIPLQYLSEPSNYAYDISGVERQVSGFDLRVNFTDGSMVSDSYRIPTSFLYFDRATKLPAEKLEGQIPTAILSQSILHVGTTAIALNRASGPQALTGITSINTAVLPTGGAIAVKTDIRNGSLVVRSPVAGEAGTTVSLTLSAPFSANTSNNADLVPVVGPALSGLAALMNSPSKGYLYKINTNTYHIEDASFLTDEELLAGTGISLEKASDTVTISVSGWNDFTSGPASAGNSNIVLFDGTSGKTLRDSGKKLSDFLEVEHNHDGVYTKQIKVTRIQLSTNQDIGVSTWTPISWQQEIMDEASAWSSGDPTKIIVPAGYSKICLKSYVAWVNNNTGTRSIAIVKNGTTIDTNIQLAAAESGMHLDSGWINCLEGDYFIVNANAGTSGADVLGAGTWGGPSWFEATLI